MAHDNHKAAGSPVDVKVCTKCGKEKSFKDFSRQKIGRYGYRADCKECASARDAEYRAKNPEREAARKKARRQADPARERAIDEAYHAAKPHKRWENRFRQRCADAGLPILLESFTKEDLVATHGDACVECGGTWDQLEHILPVIAGGEHSLRNCVPICGSCNIRRWHAFKAAAVAHYAAHLRATTEGAS